MFLKSLYVATQFLPRRAVALFVIVVVSATAMLRAEQCHAVPRRAINNDKVNKNFTCIEINIVDAGVGDDPIRVAMFNLKSCYDIRHR